MNNSLKNIEQQNALFDLYAPLLTSKQKHSYQLYYFEDLSLKEIAEELNISRNAVHATLNKVVQYLHDYENKLQLNHKIKMIEQRLSHDQYGSTDEIIALLKK